MYEAKNLAGVTVTKKFAFCYGHSLPGYAGPCANQHGHNSEVEVEFDAGAVGVFMPEQYRGMIIDFRTIKEHVQPIIDLLDHAYLNEIMVRPTAETMCCWIREKIRSTPLECSLLRVRVSETPDSFAEWRRG